MQALPTVEILAFFALGAIVASFVGVVSARLYTGQSIVAGRSRCDSCGVTLSPLALVPIISYLASAGRARCCGSRVSLLAPVTELALGALFALSYLQLGISPAFAFMLAALALLLALVLYDFAHQILPSSLLSAFVACSVVFGLLSAPSAEAFLRDALAPALAIAGFFLIAHFASRGRAMGFADAPLSFGLALLAGPAALAGFIFSFWIGGAIGIIVLLHRPRGSRMGVEVPFAPFLAAGFLLAYFTQWNPFAFVAALL